MGIEMAEIAKAIATGAASGLTTEGLRKFFSRNDPERQPVCLGDIASNLEDHIVATERWANRVQNFTMTGPATLDSVCIPLLYTVPRMHKKAFGSDTVGVDSLTKFGNIVIEAPFGSGKTNTLKELASAIIASDMIASDLSLPILIRLRDVSSEEQMLTQLAMILSVPYTRNKGGVLVVEGNENVSLLNALSGLLNTYKALLLIDGLDEVSPECASGVARVLIEMGERTQSCRIIVTSREHGVSIKLAGYCKVNIKELAREDIGALAQRWLDAPAGFLIEVGKKSLDEVIRRPLLATYLLLIYQRSGYLPERLSEIYSKVLNLQLEEWDAERGVSRISKYDDFDQYAKSRFLSSLAYQLLTEEGKAIFTLSDFEKFYEINHAQFGLPENGHKGVIEEIQAHTGLINRSDADEFEFTHLSMQEHLAALYLVRKFGESDVDSVFRAQPTVAAIAVALSSKKNQMLLRLATSEHFSSANPNVVRIFIERLKKERVSLEKSEAVGYMLIKLSTISGLNSQWPFCVDAAAGAAKAVLQSSTIELYETDSAVEDRQLLMHFSFAPKSPIVISDDVLRQVSALPVRTNS